VFAVPTSGVVLGASNACGPLRTPGLLNTEVLYVSSVPQSRSCVNFIDHEHQAFCLQGALIMGTGEAAGLIPEYDLDGSLLGYWKRLRCGCLFVSLVTSPDWVG
jgi:hypothetical protein